MKNLFMLISRTPSVTAHLLRPMPWFPAGTRGRKAPQGSELPAAPAAARAEPSCCYPVKQTTAGGLPLRLQPLT